MNALTSLGLRPAERDHQRARERDPREASHRVSPVQDDASLTQRPLGVAAKSQGGKHAVVQFPRYEDRWSLLPGLALAGMHAQYDTSLTSGLRLTGEYAPEVAGSSSDVWRDAVDGHNRLVCQEGATVGQLHVRNTQRGASHEPLQDAVWIQRLVPAAISASVCGLGTRPDAPRRFTLRLMGRASSCAATWHLKRDLQGCWPVPRVASDDAAVILRWLRWWSLPGRGIACVNVRRARAGSEVGANNFRSSSPQSEPGRTCGSVRGVSQALELSRYRVQSCGVSRVNSLSVEPRHLRHNSSYVVAHTDDCVAHRATGQAWQIHGSFPSEALKSRLGSERQDRPAAKDAPTLLGRPAQPDGIPFCRQLATVTVPGRHPRGAHVCGAGAPGTTHGPLVTHTIRTDAPTWRPTHPPTSARSQPDRKAVSQ